MYPSKRYFTLLFVVVTGLFAGLFLSTSTTDAHKLPVPSTGCPPVENTLDFTIVYGPVIFNDQTAITGTIVEARTPRGDVGGCFEVANYGHYGMMYIYGEDTSISPAIPGMRAGEDIAFYVNGFAATAVPTMTWINDHDMHEIALSAIDYAPVSASFEAIPTSGVAPLTVTFTNTSSGGYTSTLWTFGDGLGSSERNPTHIFESPGEYTVTLTASGAGGIDTITHTSYITAYTRAQADFVAVPTNGQAPLTVVFTNTSTGDYDTSLWTFGDEQSGTALHPTHIYTAEGVYTVTLAIEGLGGTDVLARAEYIVVQEEYAVYLPTIIRNFSR
jgi:PKD repeat protein